MKNVQKLPDEDVFNKGQVLIGATDHENNF